MTANTGTSDIDTTVDAGSAVAPNHWSTPMLKVSPGVTATYTRAAGESVLGGPYAITATLSPSGVLANYTITNAGASFTITARPATWTTNPASKIYGGARSRLLPVGH